ncbi:dual specificity phosphatase, catalytic domain protein, partial [Trichuris suis]
TVRRSALSRAIITCFERDREREQIFKVSNEKAKLLFVWNLSRTLSNLSVGNRSYSLKSGLMSVPTRFCRGVTSTEDGDVDKDDAESTSWAPLASLSQPCLPVSNLGPTKILPFLYLGSQQDAMDEDLLKKHRIDYVLNMSVASPKPDFLQEEHFLRIPVNDSYSEKLLPYFDQAFRFVDKVRNTNANVLVHCLAGISRSPTLVIACVMRYLRMSSEEAYRFGSLLPRWLCLRCY